MSKPQAPPVDLETFLSGMSDEAAGAARVAAHKMDRLERSIDDIRDIEWRYMWVGVIAAVLFIAGAFVVLYPGETVAPIFQALGPMVLTLMIVGLGLVIIVYGAVVRRRSAADEEKQALNREHFVPHDAYYFPPEMPGEIGRVVRFTPRKMTPKRAGPHDNVKPGTSWW
ncbi:MAG: hypothetical protein AAFR23_04100 [Pseudomonadota bacterium]